MQTFWSAKSSNAWMNCFSFIVRDYWGELDVTNYILERFNMFKVNWKILMNYVLSFEKVCVE